MQKARTCESTVFSLQSVVISPLWISSSDRTQKLKDARSEAAKEIEEIKANKEKEFKAFQQEVRPNLDIEIGS